MLANRGINHFTEMRYAYTLASFISLVHRCHCNPSPSPCLLTVDKTKTTYGILCQNSINPCFVSGHLVLSDLQWRIVLFVKP